MLVSIVICAYDTHKFNDLIDAVRSVTVQTYNNIETIVIVDGNKDLYHLLIKNNIKGYINKIILNDRNLGLSESRNKGLKVANGEIIAFLDDDAIADKNWIREIVKTYEEFDALSVGGAILPLWQFKQPMFLPEEFYWLVGVTSMCFPEKVAEVRNTFGSNLSFKTCALKSIGGFSKKVGIKGKRLLQGEEAEICMRLRRKFGKGVIYNPRAVVYHKIYPEKLKFWYLLKRAFNQGYSKAIISGAIDNLTTEKIYFKFLINRFLYRLSRALQGSYVDLIKMFSICLLTSAVVSGYATGKVLNSLKALDFNESRNRT